MQDMHNKGEFLSKWNKEYVGNVFDKEGIKNCNVGVSNLTAPMNHSKNPTLIQYNQDNKEFLMKSIEGYKAKFQPAEGRPTHRKKCPSEIKIDCLANTFLSNNPGFKVNGRLLKEPEMKKVQ